MSPTVAVLVDSQGRPYRKLRSGQMVRAFPKEAKTRKATKAIQKLAPPPPGTGMREVWTEGGSK